MSPRLSIVVPSHSRPDLLRACLTSVTRHSPPGTEWLVVDDASAGGVVGAVASEFPGVRLLRLAERGGFCCAANAGIRAAAGDVVQVLNDDTEVSAGFADAPLARLSDPRVVAVTPLVLTGDRIDSAGDEYLPAGIARKRGHGRAPTEEHLRPRRVFGASGSASFYRRSALLRAGGFDESLVAYFDDVDLSFRLNRLGEVWYEPASRVQHRVSSSYGPPNGELLALQSRNEELVFWRNLPAAQLLLWLPVHAAAVALKAVLRLREGRLLPFLRGRLAAAGCAAATLRYRRRWAGFSRDRVVGFRYDEGSA